jgi:hypothetical protein
VSTGRCPAVRHSVIVFALGEPRKRRIRTIVAHSECQLTFKSCVLTKVDSSVNVKFDVDFLAFARNNIASSPVCHSDSIRRVKTYSKPHFIATNMYDLYVHHPAVLLPSDLLIC